VRKVVFPLPFLPMKATIAVPISMGSIGKEWV